MVLKKISIPICPYLGQSFYVDFSMIGGGSYLWTLYCYYFIPRLGSLFGVIVLGCGTRQWHWDSNLLDFGIFEIGLRIRMGCGREGQICLIGNLFSMCVNHYVSCVYNFKKIQIGYYVNTFLNHVEHKLTDINRLIERWKVKCFAKFKDRKWICESLKTKIKFL